MIFGNAFGSATACGRFAFRAKRAAAIALVALLGLAAGGCKDPKDLKLMGLWSADFALDNSSPGIKPFKGYLRLFGNKKYQLHLENTAQSFDVKGTWQRSGTRLDMKVSTVDFQNPSELDQQTLKLTLVSVPDLRSAVDREFYLNFDPTETKLTGLTIHLGPLVGHEVFEKRHLDQG